MFFLFWRKYSIFFSSSSKSLKLREPAIITRNIQPPPSKVSKVTRFLAGAVPLTPLNHLSPHPCPLSRTARRALGRGCISVPPLAACPLQQGHRVWYIPFGCGILFTQKSQNILKILKKPPVFSEIRGVFSAPAVSHERGRRTSAAEMCHTLRAGAARCRRATGEQLRMLSTLILQGAIRPQPNRLRRTGSRWAGYYRRQPYPRYYAPDCVCVCCPRLLHPQAKTYRSPADNRHANMPELPFASVWQYIIYFRNIRAESPPFFTQSCVFLAQIGDFMGFCRCTCRGRIYLRKARVLRMGALFDVTAAFSLRLALYVFAAILKGGKPAFMRSQPFAKLSFSRMWKFLIHFNSHGLTKNTPPSFFRLLFVSVSPLGSPAPRRFFPCRSCGGRSSCPSVSVCFGLGAVCRRDPLQSILLMSGKCPDTGTAPRSEL